MKHLARSRPWPFPARSTGLVQVLPARSLCRGFSLVELMVALVITLILLAGVGQIFLSSKKSYAIQDTLGRQLENGRYATDLIAQELRRAGYLGGAIKAEETTGSLSVVNSADTCNTGDTTWARMLNSPVFGKNDTASTLACITNHLQGDVIVIRYAAPWEIGGTMTPTAVSGKIYLHTNPTKPKTARLYTGSTLPATIPGDRQSEIIAHAYYIGNTGQTCSYQGVNQPVPGLFRVGLDNNGQPDTPEVIVYGIEQLQVQYGLDSNPATPLSVDEYVDADSTELDAFSKWDQVISARIWVLTRAECPETGYTNTGPYQGMGDQADFIPNDNYRRQLYQTTVKLRNRLGDF